MAGSCFSSALAYSLSWTKKLWMRRRTTNIQLHGWSSCLVTCICLSVHVLISVSTVLIVEICHPHCLGPHIFIHMCNYLIMVFMFVCIVIAGIIMCSRTYMGICTCSYIWIPASTFVYFCVFLFIHISRSLSLSLSASTFRSILLYSCLYLQLHACPNLDFLFLHLYLHLYPHAFLQVYSY